VSQYIKPVGKSIRALAEGDTSEYNVDICIGALRPLISAAEKIHYNDIYEVLKSIEQPLVSYRNGKKQTLSKKDIRNITIDYRELTQLISRSVGSNVTEMVVTGIHNLVRHTPAGLPQQAAIADIPVADALEYFREIDSRDIKRLYSSGLVKIGLICQATVSEIVESTGILPAQAEQIKNCALRAVTGISQNNANNKPFDRERESDRDREREREFTILSLTRTGSEGDESPLQPLPTANPVENKPVATATWPNAIEAVLVELKHYQQVADTTAVELDRMQRAVLRLRVARERLKGELEYSVDEIGQLLQPQRLGETQSIATYRQILRSLQQAIDGLTVLMTKTEKLYAQFDHSLTELQEQESQLIALRRRPNAGLSHPLIQSATRRSKEDVDSPPLEQDIEE
jgi:hypothetical protein